MHNPRLALFRQAEIITSDIEPVWKITSPDPFFNECQGGGSDGKYYYQIFMRRDDASDEENNRSKIVKVDLATGEIVRWSEVFTTLNHSNDIVYNPRRDLLVVCHNKPHRYRVSLIDPHTLQLVESIDIGTEIYAIDYSATRDRYVVGLSGGQDLMFLDANFRPVDGVVHPATEKTRGYVTQGICADEDLVYCVLFDAKGYRAKDIHNLATVYDWSGNYVGILEFDAGYTEPENISIADNQFYLVSTLGSFDLYRLTPHLK